MTSAAASLRSSANNKRAQERRPIPVRVEPSSRSACCMGGRLSVDHCTFSGNYTHHARHGGGMANDASAPTVTNCTFVSNIAGQEDDTNYSFGGGGMLNISGASPTVANCTFAANVTTNKVNNGGGGMLNESSSPTISNCTFVGNSGSGVSSNSGGGAMFNRGSSPTIIGCSFTGNWAPGGGALANIDSAPSVTNPVFLSSSATLRGAVFNTHATSTPTLTNCTFAANGLAMLTAINWITGKQEESRTFPLGGLEDALSFFALDEIEKQEARSLVSRLGGQIAPKSAAAAGR